MDLSTPCLSTSSENQPFEKTLWEAEELMKQNLKHGKSPQSAITITCIALGISPDPLSENAILDHLWQIAYRDLNPSHFLE